MNHQNFRNYFFISALLLLAGCQRSSFNFELSKTNMEEPSALHSEIIVSDNNYADGVTPARIEVRLRNGYGAAIANRKITIRASGSQNTIVPCTPTDMQGVGTCWLYTTKAEQKEISTVDVVALSCMAVFTLPPTSKSMAEIVPAGSHLTLVTGHKITSTTGVWTSDVVFKDSFNKKRMGSTILAIMPQ